MVTKGQNETRQIPKALDGKLGEWRSAVIEAFRASPTVSSILREWTAADLYAAGGKPRVLLNLERNIDGSVLGYARDADGKFMGHARWTKTTTFGRKALSSLAAIAGHAALVEISYKLDRIESKLDRVIKALGDDRRAELRGAIDIVQDALAFENGKRQDVLVATAPLLLQSIRKEMKALERAIAETPDPPSDLRRVVWDTSSETQKALLGAEAGFLVIIEGIWTLVHLYMGLDEPKTAWGRASVLLAELLQSQALQQAWTKARNTRLANSSDAPPESFWARAMAVTGEIRTQVDAAERQLLEDFVGSWTLELSEAELGYLLIDETKSGNSDGI